MDDEKEYDSWGEEMFSYPEPPPGLNQEQDDTIGETLNFI